MKKSIFTASILAATVAMAAPAHATYYTYNANLDNGIGMAKVTIDTRTGTATYKGANINVTMTGSQIKNFKGGSTPPTQVIQADTIKGSFTKNGTTYNAYTSSYPSKPSFGFGSTGSSSQPTLWTQGKDKYGNTYNLNCGGGGSSSSTSSTSSGGSTSTSTGGSTSSTSSGGTTSTSTGGSTSGGTTSSTSSGGSTSGGTTSSTSTGGSTSSTSTGGSTSSTSTSSGGIGGSTSGGSSGGGSTGGTDVPAPGALLLFGLGAGALAFRRSRKAKD